MRACIDPSPVIDGRRANCNLASLGLQRSKPTTPLHGKQIIFQISAKQRTKINDQIIIYILLFHEAKKWSS